MARDKIHIDLVLNTKGFRPLGRINGQLGEFEKSLDASNARVLAFGASAGAILAVKKAFTATVKAAIEVEKSLKDINVILGATSQNLRKFGSDLFEIASKTGQAFRVAAEAATEAAPGRPAATCGSFPSLTSWPGRDLVSAPQPMDIGCGAVPSREKGGV